MLLAALAAAGGCAGIPANIQPVTGFDLERYLGVWYEIARLDHRFERGLTNVSATYTKRSDGGIDVFNQGFNPVKNKWISAKGKGYLVGEPDIGRLKVSFFGPFYAGYNIIALDKEEYQYAMVCGSSRSYLWILARKPVFDQSVVERLVRQAQSHGFETGELIYVDHNLAGGSDGSSAPNHI